MNKKSRVTTMEERVNIAERASVGRSSREIAGEIGYSLATVRKWKAVRGYPARWADRQRER